MWPVPCFTSPLLPPSTRRLLHALYSITRGRSVPYCSRASHVSVLIVNMQSAVLKPRDMAVYLERNWNIHVPGFVGEQLRPHR